MNTFFMFGKYSSESLRDVSAMRTSHAREAIIKMGGNVREIYALLGEFDLVFIVELPSMSEAMKAAITLGQLTGITFSTCAAIPVREFDTMAEDLRTDIESARMEARE